MFNILSKTKKLNQHATDTFISEFKKEESW